MITVTNARRWDHITVLCSHRRCYCRRGSKRSSASTSCERNFIRWPPSSSFHQYTGCWKMCPDHSKTALVCKGHLPQWIQTIFSRIWVTFCFYPICSLRVPTSSWISLLAKVVRSLRYSCQKLSGCLTLSRRFLPESEWHPFWHFSAKTWRLWCRVLICGFRKLGIFMWCRQIILELLWSFHWSH